MRKLIFNYPTFLLALFLFLFSGCEPAQTRTGDLRLLDWQPKSQMVVKETIILKPKFPVIDIHNHLGDLKNTKKYLQEMDKAGVWKAVSLDGRSAKDFYKEHLEVSQKLSKELGLTDKDKSGKVIPVDDPRIDPIWAKCGELGIPVVIHVSDPVAFHTPVDQFNERYDELGTHPNWSFYGDKFPYSKNDILDQLYRVIAKHPNTTFVSTHMGNLAEDLGRVSAWLDKYPNMYVDIDARISELGRQPYTARKFLIKYQDRVLFGADTPPDAEAYQVYYRFLETDDEYIDPAKSHHLQGRWMIYGVYLPDEVLEKIYNKNAQKILGMQKTTQIIASKTE